MTTNVTFAEHMINVTSELGPEIIRGLLNKDYERVGGVIRDIASKEVVGFMRQANLPPSKPDLKGRQSMSKLGKLFSTNAPPQHPARGSNLQHDLSFEAIDPPTGSNTNRGRVGYTLIP